MAAFLYRIGRFAARYRWWVVAAWLTIALGAGGAATALGGTLQSSFEIPGTQAQTALDSLEERFPQLSGASARVIVVAPDGESIADDADLISQTCEALAGIDDVSVVTCPYPMSATGSTPAGTGAAGQVSADGSMAFITAQLSVDAAAETDTLVSEVQSAMAPAPTAGLQVAYSGLAATAAEGVDWTELAGLAIAFIVLAITFASVLAAGVPLVTALLGVGVASSTILIVAAFAPVSSTAPLLATMLGIAVGIDYSLLITSRHRAQLAEGMPARESVAVAAATAGTAVVFAGLTVMIALLGLAVAGIPFLTVMGLGAAVAVLGALAVALTLLPALLAILGKSLRPRVSKRRKSQRAENTPVLAKKPPLWVRIATAVPLATIALVSIGLIAAAVPASDLRLTLPDAGYDPPGSQARVAYELLDKGFGPGFNGPLLVTADISRTLDIESALSALDDEFSDVAGIAAVSQAFPNEALDLAVITITPDSAPSAEKTTELVGTLRDMAPAFEQAHGFTFQVTGQTALAIDISERLASALLPFALVVVGLCLVLLTIMFRSIAVPISATLGYLFTVGATLGITTMIFEWGVGADIVGVAKIGPVISFMPILVMAVLFGLAMDYHVFLVSRMREHFTETGQARRAVLSGFSDSARVVTAAALIMFSVFFSFVPGGNAIIQPIALALAVGVLIDAFIVRMTLIPAIMILLGTKAWWIPSWLDRILPNADIEGEAVQRMLRQREWLGADGPGIATGSLRAENVSVAGFSEVTFTAEPGDLVLARGDGSGALVAALAGRVGDFAGTLAVSGNLLPFERSYVARDSVLVADLADAPGAVTVHERLRARIRATGGSSIDRVERESRSARVFDQLIDVMYPDSPPHIEAGTPVSHLEDAVRWALDVAAAVTTSRAVIAIDASGRARAADLAAAISHHAAPTATVVIACASDEVRTNRNVVVVNLEEREVTIAQEGVWA